MNHTTHMHAFANRQKQCGLSLIELMISITLGLIMLSALATLFLSQSRARTELDKSNRMIDNGRYALEILSDNLRVAGYYDSYLPVSGVPAATPDPCNLTTLTTAATNLDVLRDHVQGYNAGAPSSQIPSGYLPAACGFTYTAGSATTLKPGSDILVLRRASTATPVAVAAAVANTTYLQVSNCPTTAAYQIATGTPPSNSTTPLDRNCAAPTSLRPFIVQVYFVSPHNDATANNNLGDCIPTLKRIELDPVNGGWKTTPLVEGIEYMQVDYGLDANADGAPDSYIAAPAAANWPDIVSVKINIIARNNEPTKNYTDSKTYNLGSFNVGPFNATPYNVPMTTCPRLEGQSPKLENYKRHAYTQVVRLVNPSSRRETP